MGGARAGWEELELVEREELELVDREELYVVGPHALFLRLELYTTPNPT